ncbi:MAG: hypothetical protein IT161_16125 [Bryobacterales bacterium]|nr:hypothetical protein [Bryobacterales bacterium]
MISAMSLGNLALIFLAVLVLVSIPLAMLASQSYYCELPFRLTKPVLALELAQTKAQVDALLCAGTAREAANRARLRVHTYADMALVIPAYFLLFVILAQMSFSDLSLLAKFAMFCAAFAAAADYVEDVGILSSLGAAKYLHLTRPAALVKWAGFFAMLAALAPWWLTRLGWLDKAGGAALAVSGLWGLWAAVAANERQIELASYPLGVALAAVAWHCWRRRATS